MYDKTKISEYPETRKIIIIVFLVVIELNVQCKLFQLVEA